MCECKRYTEFYSAMKFIDTESKQFIYSEIRYWLINILSYSWRKANVRPPRFLRPGLEEDRTIFKEFILKLKETNFLIVYIDEWSFNSSTLPLYSWMKKGEPAIKVIRETSNRYNSIAAQWGKYVYFLIKTDTTKEDSIWDFIKLLINQLQLTVDKNQLKNRTVLL